jgi:pyruvate dehydrogenase E2 component (dihydrolipoamide acetyltransferase)
MAKEFSLPDLGSGLQEGQIVKWLVEVGQSVTTADDLCEVETEKAVIEIPVPFTGIVAELTAPVGEPVAVGSVIAKFDVAGDESKPAEKAQEPTKSAAKPSSKPAPTGSSLAASTGARVRCATPVRKLARENGIDVQTISGTGRLGRVTRADVMAVIEGKSAKAKPSTPSAPTSIPGTFEKFSMIRRTISDNMSKSWQEIPHVFTRIEVDATEVLKIRKTLAESLGTKVPLEAILISACLPALKKYPYFNASLGDGGIQLHKSCNIGIAVDTPSGLVIPVIKNAQDMSFSKLVDTLMDLLPRAVNRKASPEELTGATFTVNNIGAAGRLMGTSIIPLGTTGILSVGRAQEKPVAKNGMIGIAPVMEVTLSFDHRAIDGGLSQKFMGDVADYLGNPGRHIN